MNTKQNSSEITQIHPLRRRMIEDMKMRKMTEHTQQGYLRHVKRLSEFLERSPDKAKAEDVRRFQLHLETEGTSPSSIDSALSALSFFFKVTLNRPDMMRFTRRPRLPVILPDILTPSEVYNLINAAKPKYKALFSTAYGAGLRVSEVASLKVTDIDSERMMIHVHQGKLSRDRQAMLSNFMLETLRNWWRIGKAQNVMLPNGWLFPGQNPINHISVRQVERVYHEVAKSIGLKKNGAMHSFRHAFGTHLLESGVDIRVIQVLLGHRRLDSTARYCQVARNLLKKTTNPLDELVKFAKS